jgi:tetratricopeptide (TPR) repeat protein
MRYALALSEIGKIPEALAIIKEHKPQKQESAILLKIAKNAQAKNMNDEALEIYGIFIDNLPKAENISIIYFSMANIHLAKNNLTNAAENYKLAADKTNDEQVKSMALTTAANCFYNAGKFDTANAILQKLPPTPDKLLLEAQSALMSEKYLSALNKLETFLTYKNTNKQKREKALMLAITCSQKLRDNPKYEKFLKTYINCFSSSSNSSECILRMIELYRKESKDKALFELCETILLKRPDSTDNAVLVAKAASFIRNKNLREKAFLKLLDVNKIEAKGLLGICRENIPAKLKIRLLAKHNIEFSEEPEICEVYYQRAKLEYESRCYEKALKTVSILLNAKKIYIFEAIKMLQGKIYSALEQHEKARKSYSELLLAKPGTVASLEVSYLLSQSWEKSGNAEKAIATAWTGVPLNGKTTEKTKSIVKKLLQLIIRNAKEINSQEDLKDAKELLTAF